ncbi:MAG TPA: VOC family protein [Bryobacteraceae bacterium]|nr:VOC family protein [Bryobacteraceae bacterium]
MKITAVLMVDEIEKSLPFWVDRIGFRKTAEVPEGNKLGFVILDRDGAEIMLQTIESVQKDTPQFVPGAPGNNVGMFVEVEDFGDILKRLSGYPVALAERTTNYGMREIGVREPNGHIVIFAARIV